MLGRRALLGGAGGLVVAGAAAALVDTRVVPGKGHVERTLHLSHVPQVDAAIPRAATGPIVSGSFASQRLRSTVGWAVAYPPGSHQGSALPVSLALPGKGGTGAGLLHDIAYPQFLGAYVAGGGRPYAIAAVDGGDTYWHPRRDGDALGMIVDELLPLLARLALRTDAFGALGVSMGGYGSLLLARQSARGALGGRSLVVAAPASPALWSSAGSTAPGAFDDAADWRRWGDLVDDPGVDAGTALWVSCGTSDPFADATRAYRAKVDAAGGFSPGAHTSGFWRTVAAAQVAFVGDHLPKPG